jgi:hypothetical protein
LYDTILIFFYVSNSAHILIKDIEEPPKTSREIIRKLLKDPFMVGTLVSMPFFMLIAAAQLVELQSPVKGSRREQIASVLKDVGIFGSAAALRY